MKAILTILIAGLFTSQASAVEIKCHANSRGGRATIFQLKKVGNFYQAKYDDFRSGKKFEVLALVCDFDSNNKFIFSCIDPQSIRKVGARPNQWQYNHVISTLVTKTTPTMDLQNYKINQLYQARLIEFNFLEHLDPNYAGETVTHFESNCQAQP